MGFFLKKYNDELLGEMVWSEKDEAWLGCFKEKYYYSIACAVESSIPVKELIKYAREILFDTEWIADSLKNEKWLVIKSYRYYFENEINSLTIAQINFQ